MGNHKSSEHLQAQVELFADRDVRTFSKEQALLLRNTTTLSQITDLDDLPEDLPEELVRLIHENRDKYEKALVSMPKDDIEFRKRNAELYNSKFKEAVSHLKETVRSAPNPKDLPEYLGSGSNGTAYVIEVDGKQYAAKFSQNVTQANFETKPLIQAQGVNKVSQLVTYSFEDGVVIMDLLPGEDVTQFTLESPPEFSDEHINQLIETVIELFENGITIDPKPSNFMYDSESGFSILDYHLSNEQASIGDIIMSLKVALTYRDWPYIDSRDDDYEERSRLQRIDRGKVELPIMIRFLSILKQKFPHIVADYKAEFAKREADPRVGQSPLIDRRHIPEDQALSGYLSTLEDMGF